jgi:hypothetical protein
MSDLRAELERIAANFVSSLLAAMRDAPLSELAGETVKVTKSPDIKTKSPDIKTKARRHRASAAQVKHQKDVALATAKSLKGGFAKSDVMKKSGSKVDLGRALSLLVKEGKLTRKGDRRLARYSCR